MVGLDLPKTLNEAKDEVEWNDNKAEGKIHQGRSADVDADHAQATCVLFHHHLKKTREFPYIVIKPLFASWKGVLKVSFRVVIHKKPETF